LNYVKETEPISDRLMYITLGYKAPITFVNTYMPTAEYDTVAKERHHNKLREIQLSKQRNGPTYTAGDFNARVQSKHSQVETYVGPNTFDSSNVRLDVQDDGVRENRMMFINHCLGTNSIASKTFFEKPNHKLPTYRAPSTMLGSPWTRPRYETIDYILVHGRWNNSSITDIESDPAANLDRVAFSKHLYSPAIRVALVKYLCSPAKRIALLPSLGQSALQPSSSLLPFCPMVPIHVLLLHICRR